MGIPRALALVALLCAAAAPAAALSEDDERAKAHFMAGQSYYDQAAYADALKEFGEAFRISHRPPLLYNIARCYEALEQLDKAIDNLQQYLHLAPESEDREAVLSRIKNLQERQAAKAAVPDKPAPAKVEPPPSAPPVAAPIVMQPVPRRHRVATWVIGGVGVGLLAAALGTGIASQLSYSNLVGKCANNVCSPSLSGQIDSGKQLALATDILWPIGAAAVVTSIVLFIIESKRSPARAGVSPSSQGAAFARAF